MMKFPARVPVGRSVTITQLFGALENAKWYEAHGLPPAHNGLDVVFGNPKETYGTALVCPLESAYLSKVWFDTPMSTKGNGVQIGGKWCGKDLLLVFWHLSGVPDLHSPIKFGEVVGFTGNSGLCKPEPVPQSVWSGSHLHFMVYEWDGTQWVLKDPLEYVDVHDPFIGEDTGDEKDLPPLEHFIKKIVELVSKIEKMVGLTVNIGNKS